MEVVRNHSYEPPVAMVLTVRRAGDKAATTIDDSVTTVAGSKGAGARVHARRGAVAAAAVAGQLLPRGSCKVDASMHGPGHGGDGSGGGAGVLVMRRRDAASRLLPYSAVSCVVVV